MNEYSVDKIDKLIEWLIYSVREGYIKQEDAIDFIVGKKWSHLEELKNFEERHA